MERTVWLRWSNLYLLLLIPIFFANRLGLPILVLTFLVTLCLGVFAAFLESAVEELAELLGTFIGGLLFTTFGHLDDLAVGLFVFVPLSGAAASQFVEGSITGLFVLDLLFAIATAGLFRRGSGRIRFDADSAGQYTRVLALAAIGISVPTLAHLIGGAAAADLKLPLSLNVPLGELVAVILLVAYIVYLLVAVFRVSFTRRGSIRQPRRTRRRAVGTLAIERADAAAMQALFTEERAAAEAALAEQDHPTEASRPGTALKRAERRRAQREAEGSAWTPFWERFRTVRGIAAIIVLSVSTAGLVTLSIMFNTDVQQIFQAYPALDRYQYVIGLIVLPVVLGVGDIAISMYMVKERRVELVLAVAAGSCIQLVLFVAPLTAIVGAFFGHPLPLIFRPMSLAAIGVSVVVFVWLAHRGELSRRTALVLFATWALLAVAAFLRTGA